METDLTAIHACGTPDELSALYVVGQDDRGSGPTAGQPIGHHKRRYKYCTEDSQFSGWRQNKLDCRFSTTQGVAILIVIVIAGVGFVGTAAAAYRFGWCAPDDRPPRWNVPGVEVFGLGEVPPPYADVDDDTADTADTTDADNTALLSSEPPPGSPPPEFLPPDSPPPGFPGHDVDGQPPSYAASPPALAALVSVVL